MRVVGEANKYLSDQAPWKLKARPTKARMGTVLHVALQAVSDCQHAAHAVPAARARSRSTSCSAAQGCTRRCREIVEVDDLDGGRRYPVLTGDYTVGTTWESAPIAGGPAAGAADAGVQEARRVDRRGGAGPAAELIYSWNQ